MVRELKVVADNSAFVHRHEAPRVLVATFQRVVEPYAFGIHKTDARLFAGVPEEIRDKYQYYTEADISKLRKAGYKEKITPLESAVTDYVQNYLQENSYLG